MTTETPTAPPLSEPERVLNTGIEVDTQLLGTVRVKELCLEQIVALLSDITKVFELFPTEEAEQKGNAWIIIMMKDPIFLAAVKNVMAAAIEKEGTDLDGMSIKDWLKLLVALKQVMDWEELKDLFFQIVPSGALGKLTQPQTP